MFAVTRPVERRMVKLLLHVYAGATTPIDDLALHDIIMLSDLPLRHCG
ncbi:hypothetical protein [Bradyrhizobium japonicum]|nr:hypothetical protein [Bradyrhizobium japonicum]WLB23982.1 hypothetical protein QIH95_49390 [Bradyrhizobium japonicum]